MAKELPYFKFFSGEWLTGDITMCSFSAQGVFINICAFYWAKNGNLSLTWVNQRFNTCVTDVEHLCNTGILKIQEDKIIIEFLDEQLMQLKVLLEKKSRAGKASAAIQRVNRCTTDEQQMHNKGDIEVDKKKKGKINTLSDPAGSDQVKKKKQTKSIPDKTTTKIFQETEKCMPFARTLARIVQSQKNVDVTPPQKKTWANEIRKLAFTTSKVGTVRIAAAMEWYRKNAGGEYVPVIESGKSFREKFVKLEAAMERGTKVNGHKARHGTLEKSKFDEQYETEEITIRK